MDGTQATARRRLRALLAELEQVLAAESAALGQRAQQALQTAIDRKQRLLEEVQHATSSAQPERMTRADVAPDEQADWLAIRDSLARCAQANQTNGAAVALGRRSVDQLLNLMTGRSGASNVYDARGRVRTAGDPQQTREQV